MTPKISPPTPEYITAIQDAMYSTEDSGRFMINVGLTDIEKNRVRETLQTPDLYAFCKGLVTEHPDQMPVIIAMTEITGKGSILATHISREHTTPEQAKSILAEYGKDFSKNITEMVLSSPVLVGFIYVSCNIAVNAMDRTMPAYIDTRQDVLQAYAAMIKDVDILIIRATQIGPSRVAVGWVCEGLLGADSITPNF